MIVTVVTIEGVSICPADDIILINILEEPSLGMQPWRVSGEFLAKTDLILAGSDVVITLLTDDPQPSCFMARVTYASLRSNNNLTRFSFVGRRVS